MKIFAERLKLLRQEQNISAEKLAKEIGVSKMAISLWERDERTPSAEVIVLVAKYFKVSADYLCGLED